MSHKKIVFVHIPKCCGNSLIEALLSKGIFENTKYYYANDSSKATWNINWKATRLEHRDALLRNEQFLVQYYLHGNYDFIYGHLPFSPLAHDYFRDRYDWITVLREPVERSISNIKYISVLLGEGGYQSVIKGQRDPCDLMEKIIEDDQHLQIVCQYIASMLGGLNHDLSIDMEKSVETAKTSLESFKIVGFQDNIIDLEKNVSEYFNCKINLKLANSLAKFVTDNVVSSRINSFFTKTRIEKIEKAASKDIEIYKYAKKMY